LEAPNLGIESFSVSKEDIFSERPLASFPNTNIPEFGKYIFLAYGKTFYS
jgi:hypothetical protein